MTAPEELPPPPAKSPLGAMDYSDLEVAPLSEKIAVITNHDNGLSGKVARLPANVYETQEEIAEEDRLLSEYDIPSESGLGPNSDRQTAWSRHKSCRVVIKRYTKNDDGTIAAANREIQALSIIRDVAQDAAGGIQAILNYFDPANTIFVVVEDHNDQSLKRCIENQGPLTQEMLKSVVTQLFSALIAIFMAGFAHLRICDQTLFIDGTGQLMIKDFQYAHEYGKEKVENLYALTDAKYGSDIYVAPEVFGLDAYNARKAAIWSCGVAIYYMVTGQTERLSNLEHPAFDNVGPQPAAAAPPSPRRVSLTGRRSSLGGRKLSVSNPPGIITYPGSRFEVPSYVRDIVSKMLVKDPLRRAELIEVAAKVPKELSQKMTRPLMELAWLDYKKHVGPYANLSDLPELASSGSSIYSAVSNMSNPFTGLLSGRRRSSTKGANYTGFV